MLELETFLICHKVQESLVEMHGNIGEEHLFLLLRGKEPHSADSQCSQQDEPVQRKGTYPRNVLEGHHGVAVGDNHGVAVGRPVPLIAGHVVIVPKYRKKAIFGVLRKDIGSVLKDLCR
ncbi:MAG: hypothetical protein GY721_04995 [Deltaproteobacteria bacterium]|nr:hypothetical protein [Deltaproteobacteria bacterium]